MAQEGLEFLQPLAEIRRLMSITPEGNGGRKILSVDDPEDVQHVLHSPHIERNELMRRVTGDGLIFSDGDKWRERRRVMQPSFPVKMPEWHAESIEWAIAGMLERLRQLAGAGEPVFVMEEMLRYTTRLIYQVAFGIKLPVDHDVGSILVRFFDAAGETSMALLDYMRPFDAKKMLRLKEARDDVDREIDSIIELGRRSGAEEDYVLARLLSRFETEGDLDEEDIKDEVRTLLLAGAETTSNVLSWLFLLLDAHPDMCLRIEAEVDDGGSSNLLQGAINETMRLFPPVWFMSRQVSSDVMINEKELKPGDWVFICTYTAQRHSDYWDDPNSFRPERFLEGFTPPHRYSWFPFGGGRHLCLGKALGELESLRGASEIIRHFRLVRSEKTPLEPRLGMVLKPERDVPMDVVLRHATGGS